MTKKPESKMTKAQHKKRHVELHKALDELAADFITDTSRLPSKTSVMELMLWSQEQINKLS